MKKRIRKIVTPVLLIIIVIQVAALYWGWQRYQYVVGANQDWYQHSSEQDDQIRGLQSQIKVLNDRLTRQDEELALAAKSNYAEGFYRAFYETCLAIYRNPDGCLRGAQYGWENDAHQAPEAPGWNWTYIQTKGFQTQ